MDYKNTLNLPATEFQMKADLQKKEPEMLKAWESGGLYNKILDAGKGRPTYTLHDGPPYANGNIHIGHALNKILKDFIIKSRFMSGYAIDYIPGWDCHGLPIELQVEKELGQKKQELSRVDIRKRCRAYAEKFVNVQREDFKRLGVFGRWDEPYLTMNYGYQASILRELGKFHEAGHVYKGKKPVHWCSSCKTALAEAEVEYADKTSPSVYVKFRVDTTKLPENFKSKLPEDNRPCYFVIWTTTPWTLPANRALAVGKDIVYTTLLVNWKDRDEAWIIAYDLSEGFLKKIGIADGSARQVYSATGDALEGIATAHPFIDDGKPRCVFIGEHVTTDAGTGCVHIAPGHGQEDYELGLKYGLEIYNPVNGAGKFTSDVPEFEGQFVFKANEEIIKLLEKNGALLLREDIRHSYPHCWRCKSPIIFRATEQWFASMDAKGLRKDALEAIDKKVAWIPSWGKERIYNMILNRPDWCLSRQRAWGVPIPALTCVSCNASRLDGGFIDKLADLFEKEGADVWFEKDLKELLDICGCRIKCNKCGGAEFSKEENILDVWFDSGVSFAAVVKKRAGLKFPADLYLEGSDQHRGWFHSSLLASIGTRKEPPYKAVLTHGFVVDSQGRKMSKSLGNVIAPQEVIGKYGAEVLRLWVAGEDYRDDIRISEEILKRIAEAYRKIRNTLRYMLGNLSGFNPETDCVEYKDLTEIDRLTLHRLTKLTERVRSAYDLFEFHAVYHGVHNFCNVDLSSFYLDVIKDRLYTSGARSIERRAAQTTMYYILNNLLRLLAPVLVFTSDEAWSFMPGKKEESVHLASMPDVRKEWIDDGLEKKWEILQQIKSAISVRLEEARKDKTIGHPLDARVNLSFADNISIAAAIDSNKAGVSPDDFKALVTTETETLKDILIISQFTADDRAGAFITVEKAEGVKCERCWHYDTGVGVNAEHPAICPRCVDALKV